MRVRVLVLLLLSAALLAGMLLIWQQRQQSLQLSIINRSDQPIQTLVLTGTGLTMPVHLSEIAAGQSLTVELPLSKQGEIRFLIRQPGVQVDYPIVEDVAMLGSLQQQLLVEPGNRFLLQPVR